MNSPFGNLTNDGLEESEDRLGGYQPLDSNVYPATIKTAYAGQSKGGAHSVTLIADANGREYRETIYVTNKAGENFFLNRNDKTKKVPLPGFTTVDDICLFATGSPLAEQPTEDKIVNIYDYDSKKEIPTSVPMLMDLLGKTVDLGIIRQLENKNEKDGSGNYVATAETRELNLIDKVFDPETKRTVVEVRNEAETATFHDNWVERNAGNTRDKRSIKDGSGGTSGRPGGNSGGAPQAGSGAAKTSLFGKK